MAFYNAAGGTGWLCNHGWLTAAPLANWCGVEVDAAGRVTSLELSWNQMEGRLSAALGRLEFLRALDLAYNRLEGPIPPEVGQLEMLEVLDLTYNSAYSIPSELTNLPRLRRLILKGTGLEGPLPRKLVNLPELRDLDLALNGLSGPLPPGLTGMRHLSTLSLADNPITGPVPEDIGQLSALTALNLANTRMSGTLPHSLTRIEGLDLLLTGGTELCGPDDERFRQWLRVVQTQRVQPCEALASGSTAYLTQTVQSRRFPVPLVADEEALLRVFAVAPEAAGQLIPPVRATFYLNGAEAEVVEINSDASFIRRGVDESSLASSANAVIPASVIRPGLEMVVEIDPDGTLDPALGVATRLPETGRIDVDVREMPVLALTLIPLLYAPAPDSSLLDITDGLTAEDPLLWAIRTLMPVRELDLTVHEPVTTNSTNPGALVHVAEAIRVMEEGEGYIWRPSRRARRTSPAYPSVSRAGRPLRYPTPGPWFMNSDTTWACTTLPAVPI
ncbi:leucine-rich repeat domain-containing protein [Candidatus Palauibacter sp.]|uniref:leucine-rich repeat domain-containing protein n=1 Tax=Candidatus Palauibacter sp. TaxID=3101350 RepID=UPI003CC5B039